MSGQPRNAPLAPGFRRINVYESSGSGKVVGTTDIPEGSEIWAVHEDQSQWANQAGEWFPFQQPAPAPRSIGIPVPMLQAPSRQAEPIASPTLLPRPGGGPSEDQTRGLLSSGRRRGGL